MRSLGSTEIENIIEKLIIFKNELIRKNRINNRIKKDLDDYNSNIRYLFNEEEIYNGINDIKYLINENEDKITHNINIKYRGIKDIRYLFNENKDKITHNCNIKDIRCLFYEDKDKESPFKSIIEDIKRGLYYVEKMNNLSTSDIKNNNEKLIKFKNELFKNNNNNNNMIKKSDFYKTEKIKYKKDLNEYKGIKDIRYLFNDNIYKGIIDIKYLFNEDYYAKKLDSENIKSEFNKLSNNLVMAYLRIIFTLIFKNRSNDYCYTKKF